MRKIFKNLSIINEIFSLIYFRKNLKFIYSTDNLLHISFVKRIVKYVKYIIVKRILIYYSNKLKIMI